MKKIVLGALASVAAFIVAPAAQAAIVINVDGFNNASVDGTKAVTQTLNAGTYKLTFTTGDYTAFNRFSSSTNCVNGANCYTGYENSVRYVINGTTFRLGDRDASGGLAVPSPDGSYYETAAISLANASKYSAIFTLNASTDVSFYIFDDNLGDNVGGVSVLASAVPEPATWAMMLMGFGMVGFGMRSRRKANVAVAYA